MSELSSLLHFPWACLNNNTCFVQVVVSVGMKCEVSICVPLLSQLSRFFPYCHLSYLGLITGHDVGTMTEKVVAGTGLDKAS